MIEWHPVSGVEWKPVSKPAEKPEPADPSFKLLIHCATGEQREQIKNELEKHGIKCVNK